MAHGAHVQSGNQRALAISAVLTGVYFVVEITAGILIGSVRCCPMRSTRSRRWAGW